MVSVRDSTIARIDDVIGWAEAQVRERFGETGYQLDPGLAIKFTLHRAQPSGSAGDPDVFGSQQYGPLLGIEGPAD